MNVSRTLIGLAAALTAGALPGCFKPAPPPPGVTYNVSAVIRGADGRPKPQGEATSVASAVVDDVQELGYEGGSVLVQVRKTEYGKAIFEVTFPDKSRQRVAVKAGESAVVLPTGQKLGLRIEVQEAR
jgi:hypothetical protein